MGAPSVSQAPFGQLSDGRRVHLFSLSNGRGMEVRITTYGGIVVSLTAPDRAGIYADVVLGHDSLQEYVSASPYFGALIGRYANRIANAKFALGGKTYRLASNDGANTLHGGVRGFDKVPWNVVSADVCDQGPKLVMSYLSPDGEEGFPGNLMVTATYLLTKANALQLEYSAVTDAPTVVNLTQHSYFNLRGEGDILDHVLTIRAERFAPLNEWYVPTGEFRSVADTAFDFSRPTPIGARIHDFDEQLRIGHGYDHDWPTRDRAGPLAAQATVYEPVTGRALEVLSTQPSLRFYSGNFLDGTIVGKRMTTYEARSGFCLEPQHLPDSPNKPYFPSTVLEPGQHYENTIVWRFSAR